MNTAIEKELTKLKVKKVRLNEEIKEIKNNLKSTTRKLKTLKNKEELLNNKANLDTTVTVQDLWDKFNNLDYKKDFEGAWCYFHTTPLKERDLEFYKDKIKSRKNLKYRFVIELFAYNKPDGIHVKHVNISSFIDEAFLSRNTIISQMDEKVDLHTIFTKYVELRNEYLNENINYKDTLIPIKIYFEDKKNHLYSDKYLKVMRQKDDLSLLNVFAQEFDLNTDEYYVNLQRLNQDQLHDIAQSIRDNKEQLFRWNLSYKWKDEMKARVEFDMTPIFKTFKKYNIELCTPSVYLGYDIHRNYKFTLDGRKYKVEW